MILNNAPQNEAILSNVGEIGEFRIRNSAKAFNILSSGLYANKVRAIIRELSCNAVDSHIDAGRESTPFDVHLPNTLEPHFSIRDYGTGLTHDQVTQIYTTYFESTKTDSNSFIGALGLGSKSPFSYTDNFTVTAIKNGHKGVYTAFINGEGVPSIALMAEEDTDEPSGVEIKFAVDNRWDFDKFRQEARNVYKHFALRPNVSGSASFEFDNAEYESKDIVPGVHAYPDTRYKSTSYAVMGNIAYPIDVPNAEENLGKLGSLLDCGLEMHFEIGELDFQASREGLSYITSTVDAIKSKLTAVNSVLVDKIAEEANAIENLWDRALFLYNKKDHKLWSAAVSEYVKQSPLPTYDDSNTYTRLVDFEVKVEDMAADWNIRLRVLQQSRGSKVLSNARPRTVYSDTLDADGMRITYSAWEVPVSSSSHFIVNDTKTGAGERARYHYRTTDPRASRTIWILEKADKTKEMDVDAFFAAIHNPPEDRRFLASSLEQKPRHGVGRNVNILRLERRNNGGWTRRDEMVWRDAGDTSKFDDSQTYYYVPLNGFQLESTKGYTGGKELYEDVCSVKGLFQGEIYGVRKKDIESIRQKSNWKNFEDHIAELLAQKDLEPLMLSLAVSDLDRDEIFRLPNRSISFYLNGDTDYEQFVNKFKSVDKYEGSVYNLKRLVEKFVPGTVIDPTALIQKYQTELDQLNEKYPLLRAISTYRTEARDIAEYINLVNSKKED